MASGSSLPSDAFDVLCVGFGPAALAVGVQLAEYNSNPTKVSLPPSFASLGGLQEALASGDASSDLGEGSARGLGSTTTQEPRALKVCFVEKSPCFSWHPGMMLPGSRMQISFLKDMATVRNPSSPYTFLSYLHSSSQSRLLSFISLGTLTPSRQEYADYLHWCSQKITKDLASAGGESAFGEQVVAVEAVLPDQNAGAARQQDIKLLRVTSRNSNGDIVHRLTRNIVVSTGGSPRFPPSLNPASFDCPILHSSEYLYRIESLLDSIVASPARKQGLPIRIAVVGAGQSGAELFLALRSSLAARLENLDDEMESRPRVELFTRRSALRPADDSPFSNEVFDPGMSHAVYKLEPEARAKVMDESRNTNYSVVNPRTLATVYDEMYNQKVDEDIARSSRHPNPSSLLKDPKLAICPYANLLSAIPLPDSKRVRLTFNNVATSENWDADFDAVVCATGYSRHDPAWRLLFPDAQSSPVAGTTATLDSIFEAATPSPSLPLRHQFVDSETSSPALSVSSRTSSPSSDAPRYSQISTPQSSTTSLRSVKSSASDPFPVAENYRLLLPSRYAHDSSGIAGSFKPTIWMQGNSENTHGISDSLLSVLAVRAGEVLDGLLREGNLASV